MLITVRYKLSRKLHEMTKVMFDILIEDHISSAILINRYVHLYYIP